MKRPLTHKRMPTWVPAATLAAWLGAAPSVMGQSAYQFVELRSSAWSNSADVQGTQGVSVNDAGQVVGLVRKRVGSTFSVFTLRWVPRYNLVPTRWSIQGVPTELPVSASEREADVIKVRQINEFGIAVGSINQVPVRWHPTQGLMRYATKGQINAINRDDLMMGAIEVTETSGQVFQRAALFRQGPSEFAALTLGLSTPSDVHSEAVALNKQGTGLFNIRDAQGVAQDCIRYTMPQAATFPMPRPAGQGCEARGLSDEGTAFGYLIDPQQNFARTPVFWRAGTYALAPGLTSPPGSPNIAISAINASGVAVGADREQPVIWRNQQASPLTTPVKGLPTRSSRITGLWAISDNGKLVASVDVGGVLRWGLLLPTP
jgi:hypothetical protein